MAVRPWYLARAIGSFATLNEVLHELTEEEVLAALDLEAASQRRPTTISRLISRAVRLRELSYSTSLKEKYHGPSQEKLGRTRDRGG